MPPIEMIASPVRDRIIIPIPKKYRAYSFQVILVPVSEGRSRTSRRVARKVSAAQQRKTVMALAGEWCDDRTDEEIIADIESSRTFGREVVL